MHFFSLQSLKRRGHLAQAEQRRRCLPRSKPIRGCCLMLERLEERLTFANVAFAAGVLQISPSGAETGVNLTLTQTSQNDFQVMDGASNLGTYGPVSDLQVTGGNGDDAVTLDLNNLAYTGKFEAITNSGNDIVQVQSTGGAGQISGNLNITSGDGSDSVTVGAAVTVGGNLSINLGNGNDSVTVDAAVGGAINWQLGNGNDSVTIGNAPGGLLTWNSGNGNDSVTFGDATNTPGEWNVHMQFGTGSDTVTLAGNGTVATPNQLTGVIDTGGPPGVDSFDPTGSLAAGTWVIIPPFSRMALSASGASFTLNEGRSRTVTVANFTEGSAAAPTGDFTATINWGDGHTTGGAIVSAGGGHYHVLGTHAYAEEATYSVKLTIKDADGFTVSATSSAKVLPSPLDEAAGASFTTPVNTTFTNHVLGSFRDQDALNKSAADYQGTITWGDGKTSAASFRRTGSNTGGSFWQILGTHKYTAKKMYSIKVSFADKGNIGTFPATVITLTITVI
jgi:hypothetical protein